jgi:hypothetical protein
MTMRTLQGFVFVLVFILVLCGPYPPIKPTKVAPFLPLESSLWNSTPMCFAENLRAEATHICSGFNRLNLWRSSF